VLPPGARTRALAVCIPGVVEGEGEMVGLVGAGLWPHVTVRAREGAGVGVLM